MVVWKSPTAYQNDTHRAMYGGGFGDSGPPWRCGLTTRTVHACLPVAPPVHTVTRTCAGFVSENELVSGVPPYHFISATTSSGMSMTTSIGLSWKGRVPTNSYAINSRSMQLSIGLSWKGRVPTNSYATNSHGTRECIQRRMTRPQASGCRGRDVFRPTAMLPIRVHP
jgi:hypothetical protein